MKRLFIFGCVVFFALVAWRIGSQLSADAIGMAVGLLFGVLAGIPAALLVLASNRRREMDRRSPGYVSGTDMWRGHAGQSPVIILAAPGFGHPGGGYSGFEEGGRTPVPVALPGPQSTVDVRDFRVVGEQVEDIDEW